MEHLGFARKFFVCLLAGLLTAAILRRVLALYFAAVLPRAAIWAISLSCLLACLGYAFAWQRQKKTGKGNTPSTFAFFQCLIVYTLAFDLASFGWQKICHLQMVVPLGVLDLPFNRLDGETLTWAYFRRSYPFTVAIAASQMASAYLLLWKRTRLLGLICMVPILLNIILIDTFYHLPIGVLVHAIILMAVVIYLLMQFRSRLVDVLFRMPPAGLTGPANGRTGHILRAVVILVPLIFLATYAFPDKHPRFTGKYRVGRLMVNGIPVEARSTKDSVLTTVYMDWQDDLVLEFNNHLNRYFGTYQYDPETDSLHAHWRYPPAFKMPFSGSFKKDGTQENYIFKGQLGDDNLEMKLERVPEP